MHCVITDRYFNVFFVEIQLKKGNLKYFLGAKVWVPKQLCRSPKRPEYITALVTAITVSNILQKIILEPSANYHKIVSEKKL